MNQRHFLILSLLTLSITTFSQKKERENQWWVGLKSGINLSLIQPGDRYSVLQSTNSTDNNKKYSNITSFGYQYGIISTFDFSSNFSATIQPSYIRHVFGYQNNYEWTESGGSSYDLKLNFDHSLDFIEIPLYIRFEYPFHSHSQGHKDKHHKSQYSSKVGSSKRGKTIPYIQVGISYSLMIGAEKNIIKQRVDNGFKYPTETDLVGVTDLFNQNHWATVFSGGVSYDVGGSFRIALNVNYKHGLDNLTNQKNRYSIEKLSSAYYDAFDDMKIRNWDFSVHFLFPMKFVYSGNFKSI